jgi:sec-independent protein translocase protein TatB
MFNIGAGEIALILIAALVLLGPERLPELARTIGKFYRDFRRHSDEVRGVVLREFYKMEQTVAEDPTTPDGAPIAPEAPKPVEVTSGEQKISILPAAGAVARGGPPKTPDKVPEKAPLSDPDPLAEGETTLTQVDTQKETGS